MGNKPGARMQSASPSKARLYSTHPLEVEGCVSVGDPKRADRNYKAILDKASILIASYIRRYARPKRATAPAT